MRSSTLIKQRLWYKCFPAHFRNFLEAPLSKNTYGHCLPYTCLPYSLHLICFRLVKAAQWNRELEVFNVSVVTFIQIGYCYILNDF